MGVYKVQGFPKLEGPFLGVLMIRTSVFGCLHWGTAMLEDYHISYNHSREYFQGG